MMSAASMCGALAREYQLAGPASAGINLNLTIGSITIVRKFLEDRRVDPADDEVRTLQDLYHVYDNAYTDQEIVTYWAIMKVFKPARVTEGPRWTTAASPGLPAKETRSPVVTTLEEWWMGGEYPVTPPAPGKPGQLPRQLFDKSRQVYTRQ